jgi:hypothetical protein
MTGRNGSFSPFFDDFREVLSPYFFMAPDDPEDRFD